MQNTSKMPVEEQTSGKLVAYIGTPWCKYCKTTKPALEEIEGEMNDTRFLAVDADEYPEVAQQAKVKTYPTIIVYRDGVELDRRGSGSNPELKEWIEQAFAKG